MSDAPVINQFLSTELTNAIHSGNASETERLLKLIQELGGEIIVEPIDAGPGQIINK